MINGIRRRLTAIKIKSRLKVLDLYYGSTEDVKYRSQPHRMAKKRPFSCPLKHCRCCHPGKYDNKIEDDALIGIVEE